ncbi:hypothetical protein [Photobacterium damselae]|uniref:hypothetical protein n=1 Tax=Photobacterium damselae TaxID=38293 RepID=UPI00370A6887
MISHKMRFTFVKSGILSELDSYMQHSDQVESLLNDEVKAFEDRHKNIAATMDQDQAEEYLEYMSDEYWELADKLPSIQRKSELISIYTLLENGLNQICSIYEHHLTNPIKLADLSSHGIIDKSKKYLEKVAQINFPSQTPKWEEIKKVQQIRNAFVHRDGLIKSNNQEIVNYINQSNYLSLKNQNKVVIKKGFTLHCLKLFRDFFEELFKDIETID